MSILTNAILSWITIIVGIAATAHQLFSGTSTQEVTTNSSENKPEQSTIEEPSQVQTDQRAIDTGSEDSAVLEKSNVGNQTIEKTKSSEPTAPIANRSIYVPIPAPAAPTQTTPRRRISHDDVAQISVRSPKLAGFNPSAYTTPESKVEFKSLKDKGGIKWVARNSGNPKGECLTNTQSCEYSSLLKSYVPKGKKTSLEASAISHGQKKCNSIKGSSWNIQLNKSNKADKYTCSYTNTDPVDYERKEADLYDLNLDNPEMY